MDLTRTIVPKSDQKNADDFLAGPQTFTITDEIEYDNEQQPAGLVLDGDTAHPYKPNKSMRRVLNIAWGKVSYVGRRITLYTDPTIKFGGAEVGGIRISHLSHIDGPLKFKLTVTKGKKDEYVVQPLPDEPAAPSAPTVDTIAACDDLDQLRAWHRDYPDLREQITARATEVKAFAAVDERLVARDAEATA